jgi:hypothetical protein
MKKQPRTKIKDLVDRESKFRVIDNNQQRQLVGGAARLSLSLGSVGSRLKVVSSCTACGDCDCD